MYCINKTIASGHFAFFSLDFSCTSSSGQVLKGYSDVKHIYSETNKYHILTFPEVE